MSQQRLADLSGIPRGRIANWISRKVIPSAEDIEVLSKFFNVQPYYFFMEPGTQGEVRSLERYDAFKALLDDLAVKCLNEIELDSYRKEGADEYIRVLRTNYETSHILPVQWCLKINQELAKYANVDLQKKLDQLMGVQVAKKA